MTQQYHGARMAWKKLGVCEDDRAHDRPQPSVHGLAVCEWGVLRCCSLDPRLKASQLLQNC